MSVKIANSEYPDQTASSVFRSSLIWVCAVCLGLYDKHLVFEILEHLPYVQLDLLSECLVPKHKCIFFSFDC